MVTTDFKECALKSRLRLAEARQ